MVRALKFLFLVSAGFFLMSNSFNPPQNVTSGPNQGTCGSCHTGNLMGTITIDGFPDDGIAAGETYTLNLKIQKENQGVMAGFQLGIFNENGDKVGKFENPSMSSNIEGDLWEHRPAQEFKSGDEVSWTVDWVAPDDVSGLTLYTSSVIANDNGNNRMDGVINAQMEVKENTVSSRDVNGQDWTLRRSIRGLEVDNPYGKPYHLEVFNLQGDLIQQFDGVDNFSLFPLDLSHGVMIARIMSNEGIEWVEKL